MKYVILFFIVLGTGLTYSARDDLPATDVDSRVNEFIAKYYPLDSGFVYTGTIDHTDRDLTIMSRICKHGRINGSVTPLCDNREMYYKGKKIFENRGVPFDIALGIMFAESHIGVNYAGSCDSTWNNRGGIKRRKNDDGTNTKDQAIPNNGCRLYKFESIEDYFRSKANTLGLGYRSCFLQERPITCISFAYVGNRYVSESSRVKRVALIAE